MALETLLECPLCHGTHFIPYLVCKDHTLSQEDFQLRRCAQCNFVFTNPRPNLSSIAKYYQSEDYISHSGRTTGLISFLYLSARTITLRWKIHLIKKYISPTSLLDYGCGTGELLNAARKQGWQIAGVEPAKSAGLRAAQLTGIPIAQSLEELGPATFDVITLWHVLEHISDLDHRVSALRERLNPNGIILLAVPNHESYDGKFYGPHWAGYDVPRHLSHFSKATMNTLIHSAGLRITDIHPMKLDAYYVSMLSEKYKTGTNGFMSFVKGILRGFISNLKAASSINHSSLIYVVRR